MTVVFCSKCVGRPDNVLPTCITTLRQILCTKQNTWPAAKPPDSHREETNYLKNLHNYVSSYNSPSQNVSSEASGQSFTPSQTHERGRHGLRAGATHLKKRAGRSWQRSAKRDSVAKIESVHKSGTWSPGCALDNTWPGRRCVRKQQIRSRNDKKLRQ